MPPEVLTLYWCGNCENQVTLSPPPPNAVPTGVPALRCPFHGQAHGVLRVVTYDLRSVRRADE